MKTLVIISAVLVAACQLASGSRSSARASGMDVELVGHDVPHEPPPSIAGSFIIRGLDTAHSSRVSVALAAHGPTRQRLVLPPGAYGVSFVPTLAVAPSSGVTAPAAGPTVRLTSFPPHVIVVTRGAFTSLRLRYEPRLEKIPNLETLRDEVARPKNTSRVPSRSARVLLTPASSTRHDL